MRDQLTNGIDPLEAKKTESDKPVNPTFEMASRQVHADLLPGWKNDKHGKQWIATLKQYAFPFIGSLPLDTITPARMVEVLRPIAKYQTFRFSPFTVGVTDPNSLPLG